MHTYKIIYFLIVKHIHILEKCLTCNLIVVCNLDTSNLKVIQKYSEYISWQLIEQITPVDYSCIFFIIMQTYYAYSIVIYTHLSILIVELIWLLKDRASTHTWKLLLFKKHPRMHLQSSNIDKRGLLYLPRPYL